MLSSTVSWSASATQPWEKKPICWWSKERRWGHSLFCPLSRPVIPSWRTKLSGSRLECRGRPSPLGLNQRDGLRCWLKTLMVKRLLPWLKTKPDKQIESNKDRVGIRDKEMMSPTTTLTQNILCVFMKCTEYFYPSADVDLTMRFKSRWHNYLLWIGSWYQTSM